MVDNNNNIIMNNDNKEINNGLKYNYIQNFISEYQLICEKYIDLNIEIINTKSDEDKKEKITKLRSILFKLKILDKFISFTNDLNININKLSKVSIFIENNDNIKKILNYINKENFLNAKQNENINQEIGRAHV